LRPYGTEQFGWEKSLQVKMSKAKDHTTEIIKRQPDESSYDEIVRELAFELMVQRGLKDSDDGRTISNEEMQRRIKTWQK
jgi:predicted transcriptional regulator